MEREKPKVIWMPKAAQSIFQIYLHICQQGYIERAVKFTDKLYEFGETLVIMPEKFRICRQPKLAKRKMRCVPFRKNYIFIHKAEKNNVVIYNIIHGKIDPGSWDV